MGSPNVPAAPPGVHAGRTRFGLLLPLLALVSLVGYALRSNITIAQEFMAPELGLSMATMGTISAWGFQLAYALFQLPGGILADRFGPRIVLTLAILGWGIASFASGLVVAGPAAFLALFGARIVLGVSQAATYPVGAMAIAEAVPVNRRATANSVFIAFALLGAAIAPLTLAPLMARAGWRSVFMVSGVAAMITALLWYLFAPVPPRAASAGRSLVEHARAGIRLLGDRDLLFLSLAYFLHSAVFFVFIFWFFRYLIDGRGFDLLASGVWGSVPPFTAFLLAPLGGLAADRLSRRMIPGVARRRVAMACLFGAATLVVIGANAPGAVVAIAALSLSVAAINAAEGSFWATATALGKTNPGAAGGVMNLMGNLGGVVSIWAVPRMRDPLGWAGLLGVWAAVAAVAALLWLAVRVERD